MPTEPTSGPPDAPRAEAPSERPATPAPAPAKPGKKARADDPTGENRMKRIVRFSVIGLAVMFLYTVVADRLTPYTSQATVDTFLVQIAPEVSGPVVSVDVVDNHEVTKGQVLFRIDPAQFEIAQQAAEASLALAMQNANSSAADVRVADATLQGQRVDLAASEELGGIVLDLAAKKALAETSAIRARADIARTRAQIERGEAEADRARIRLGEEGENNSQVRQARAALEQAKLDLAHSTVRAPANGAVTHLRLAPGQFANRGQPVLSFVAAGPRWVTADLRENQLGNVARGNRALVTFDDRPGEVFAATVESVGWGVAIGGETPNGQLPTVDTPAGWLREPQRFPVRVVLDPPAEGEEPLPPGRSGAQASVVILTRETSLMNPLARLWMWASAKMSYLR
jgi:multidrug resistance efflux pump